MKKILITGKDSYIGTSVEKWLMKEPDKYSVDTLDVKGNNWKDYDFTRYDTVFHVAGIVHLKEKPEMNDLYFKVNRDLAYEIAEKSKKDGIKQFVFLSSMSIYGIEQGVITRDTMPAPKSIYGKSKLEAEKLIEQLNDSNFKMAILRPPMVYGEGCKGNYPRLVSLAKKTPIFPDYPNKRSMIYIDNLSEFIKQLIDNDSKGLFFPQNKEYVCTSEMVKLIAKEHNREIYMTKLFNSIIKGLTRINTIGKVFGDLVYDMEISDYES